MLLSYSNDGRSKVETPVNAILINADLGRFRLTRQTPGQTLSINNPFAVRVNYEAGYPMQNSRIDLELELAALRLANADFAFEQGIFRDSAFANFQDDFVDLFDRASDTQIPVIDRRLLDLGSKRGHYEAYNVFKRRNTPGKGAF